MNSTGLSKIAQAERYERIRHTFNLAVTAATAAALSQKQIASALRCDDTGHHPQNLAHWKGQAADLVRSLMREGEVAFFCSGPERVPGRVFLVIQPYGELGQWAAVADVDADRTGVTAADVDALLDGILLDFRTVDDQGAKAARLSLEVGD